jgi:hypothetical protein
MRFIGFIAVMLVMGTAFPARGGITVTSYDTQAQANAYAPLDQSSFYAQDDHPNASPAVGDVSGNWTGTNVGGSTPTWNMIASAHIDTVTTATPNSLTIADSGSYSYEIKTFAGFVDPSRSVTLYGPGAGADYQCVFTIDSPASYSISGQLNHNGSFIFGSSSAGTLVDSENPGAAPKTISLSGTIPPGQYGIDANASNGGPTPLPDGINDVTRAGGFGNLTFSLQVPEPNFRAASLLALVALLCSRVARVYRCSSVSRACNSGRVGL